MENTKKIEAGKIWDRHKKGWSGTFSGKVLADAKKLFPELKGKELVQKIWDTAYWKE